MEDELLIFTENEQKRSKYSKGILTARILIFVLAGICLLIAVLGFILGVYAGDNTDSAIVVYSFGGFGLLYIILGVLSAKRPFISILVTAFFNSILLLSLVISLLTINNLYQDIFFSGPPIVLLFLIVFLIRGAIYAWKFKRVVLQD